MPTSVCRTHTRNFHSTKDKSSSNVRRYIAIGSAASLPGLWWILTTGDDVPQLKGALIEDLSPGPGPCKDQVTRILSQEAYSFSVRNVTGVTRYDGTQLASNSPCEDRFMHGRFPSPWKDGTGWMAWGVFDGHAGWQTAELLTEQLMPSVQRSLGQVQSLSDKEPVPEVLVQRAIMQGFVNLDDSIMKPGLDIHLSTAPLQEKVKTLALAWAGSCALLSVYDPGTSTLHVACTGDSRAVLGQQNADGNWEAIPLSIDQTGSNEEEVTRIYTEHPGEEDIVKDGRVLGMMVSRAFGDSRWKWPLDVQKNIKRRFYGPSSLTPRYDVRTPPYLTAEPVVTSTKIDPTRPSFLIMATDGMWDTVSSQQGVDLVGSWLESQAGEGRNSKAEPSYGPFDFRKFWNGVNWKFVGERTTTQDDNAAVHLVRNSLGGNHHELIAGRLAFSPPFSRRVRDDITVQVVFFGAGSDK